MVNLIAHLIGGALGSYLILVLVMYGTMKVRRKPQSAIEVALAGIVTLAIVTVAGGYGMQDARAEPQFLRAFITYFGPAMLVTVIELVRLDRHKDRASRGA